MEAFQNVASPDLRSDFFKIIEHLCFKCGKVLAKTVFFYPRLSGWNFDRLLCGECDKSKRYYTSRTSLVESNELSNHFNANVTEKLCAQRPDSTQETASEPRENGVKRTAVETEITEAETKTVPKNKESQDEGKDDRPWPRKRRRFEPAPRSKKEAVAENASHLGGRKNFVTLPGRELECLKCHGVIKDQPSVSLAHEVRCVRGMNYKCVKCDDFVAFVTLSGLLHHLRNRHPKAEVPRPDMSDIEKYLVKLKSSDDGRYVDLGSKKYCQRCSRCIPKQACQKHLAKCWNEFNNVEASLNQVPEEAGASEELAPDFDQLFRPFKSATENTLSPKKEDEGKIGADDQARLSEENVQERFETLSKTRQKCLKCLREVCHDYRATLNHEISCWRDMALKCTFCQRPKIFRQIQTLRQHVKDVHPDVHIPGFVMADFEEYLFKPDGQESIKKPEESDQISAEKQDHINEWLSSMDGGKTERRSVEKQRLSELVQKNSPEKAFRIISDKRQKCLNCGDVISRRCEPRISHEVRCWRGMIFKCFYCENPTPYLCYQSLRAHVKKAHEGKVIPACNYVGIEKHLAEIGSEQWVDFGTKVKCIKCGIILLKTSWEEHKEKCGLKDPLQNLSDLKVDAALVETSEEMDPLQVLSGPRIEDDNERVGEDGTRFQFQRLPDGRKRCSKCRRKVKFETMKILSHEVWCWRGLVFKCDICQEPKVFYRLDSLIKHRKDYHPGAACPQPNREEIEKYVGMVKISEDGRYLDLGEKVKCTRCGLESKKLTWQKHESKCWAITPPSSSFLASPSVAINSSDTTENEFCPEIHEVFGNFRVDEEFEASKVVKLSILKSETTSPTQNKEDSVPDQEHKNNATVKEEPLQEKKFKKIKGKNKLKCMNCGVKIEYRRERMTTHKVTCWGGKVS